MRSADHRQCTASKVVPPTDADAGARIAGGESLSPARLIKFLVAQGYQEVDLVRTQGEFARRGGLLDLFVPAANRPTRLDFFGDTLESMRLTR